MPCASVHSRYVTREWRNQRLFKKRRHHMRQKQAMNSLTASQSVNGASRTVRVGESLRLVNGRASLPNGRRVAFPSFASRTSTIQMRRLTITKANYLRSSSSTMAIFFSLGLGRPALRSARISGAAAERGSISTSSKSISTTSSSTSDIFS